MLEASISEASRSILSPFCGLLTKNRGKLEKGRFFLPIPQSIIWEEHSYTMDFSQHFTYHKLLRYAVSPIVMMVFASIYSVVDGLFLSNFVGKEAFAAVNFILPYLMLFSSIGFMFGTGGSALISKTLGEKNEKKANEIFSSLVLFSALSGVAVSVIGSIFLRPIAL